MNNISVIDWGLTEYKDAFEKQKEIVNDILEGNTGNTLIFTEHPPTYTFGVRKEGQTHVLWDDNKLKEMGISTFKTNRGGDVTYHGPGQIVCYPIINLQKKKDLNLYLRNLEQALINSLEKINIQSGRRESKTGIWIAQRKIAAIGIAVRRWVTYHGFALNVNNDLHPFSGIIPCGISPKDGLVTSVKQELSKDCCLNELKSILTIEFSKIFTDI